MINLKNGRVMLSIIIAMALLISAVIISEPSFAAIGDKLIGADTLGNASTSPNRLILGRFLASKTGTVEEIHVYSRANGNVKVAIYSDIVGLPGMRLGYNNISTAVTAGQWNIISIPSTSITSGTYYWLAAANDVKGAISFTSTPGSGTSKGKNIDFSTFTFPATAGTGFTNYSYERAFAGWGYIATTENLVGTDTLGNASTSDNRVILGRFLASKTGTVEEIHVYSRANGNVKAAIYSDNDGQPGIRLGYNNTSTTVTAGQWNTISIPSTPIFADTYYWLAAANDVKGAISFTSTPGSGTSKGKNVDFSTFTFPVTTGTGFTNYSYERAFAGWGYIATTENLVGTDTLGNASTSPNRLILGRFLASKTGTVEEIHVYSRANGNVKVAIYSDNDGQPGIRLSYNNTSTAVTAGQWNIISISSTPVFADTYYWLAAANDVKGAISFTSTPGSGTSKGKNIDFSTFTFPVTTGTGFTNYSYERAFAGYSTAP